jgi:hypothetical protein
MKLRRNNMKKSLLLPAVLFLCVFFGACQKDPVNDGELAFIFKPINLSASLSTTSSLSGQPVAAGTNGSINWTTGRFNIQKIELSAKKEAREISLEQKNLTNIDVLKLGTIAGSIPLPTGTYNDVEIKLSMVVSETNRPLTLVGKYIEASGTQIPVEVHFNENLALKKSASQIVIRGDKYTADITLEINNLAKNLTQSDFGQTTRGTGGGIFVSSTVNTALYNKLKANLELVPVVLITHQ